MIWNAKTSDALRGAESYAGLQVSLNGYRTHMPSSFAISARMMGVDIDFRLSSTDTYTGKWTNDKCRNFVLTDSTWNKCAVKKANTASIKM